MSLENKNTTYFGLTAKPRPIIALMIPLLALLLQWLLWSSIQPFVWFLFYPAVFVSSWIGGKRAGFAATALSALIVWWFFISPQHSFALEQPAVAFTIIIFVCTGILFSLTHDSLRNASTQALEAMAALRDAKHQLEDRVKARTAELETISESLKDSESRFRSVMENIPSVAVQGYSIDGTVVFWNKASENLYGYSSEEAMGANLLDLIIPPDMRSGVSEAINQMKTSGQPIPPGELLLRRKDGTLVPVFSSHALVKSIDGQNQMFCLDIDLTKQKQADEALRASEKDARAIIEALPMALAMTDLQGNITYLNQEFIQTVGYTLEDIPTLEKWWPLAYPNPQYRERISDDWQKQQMVANLVDRPFTPEEKSIMCKDGVERTFICSATPLQYNNTGSILIFFYDITERKQLEAEKLDLELQRQHSQKMESLGVLAGGIAHDFNNILAIIIGHCSLVKMNFKTAEEHVPSIEKAAERAAELCRQMLAYAGKAQYVQSRVDITALVEEMVKLLKSTISQNAVIKFHMPGDIPYIKADAGQISQIVMNLIINAAEAIGEAHGEIDVSLIKSEIKSDTEKDHLGKHIPAGNYICLEVTDNGCGMDIETRQRIFEPFFTTKFTGRGLGMSAVLGIITAHGGALQMFSQSGQGTTFKVYLPVITSDSEGESFKQKSSAPWQGNGTILLAEDEQQLALLVKTMLKKLGFTVIEASNGKEALERYHQNAADICLVLTDMGMPVMDGYELFHELKKLDPDLPIIISSGFGDTTVTAKISGGNIAGLVSKPYSFEQLRSVLKNVLENKTHQ